MNEELEIIVDVAKDEMGKVIAHLERELRNIRAGKATPSMLGSVTVDYYGSRTKLSQIANVAALDAQTITAQPWEKNMLVEIEKGIMLANIGFNPMNNGEMIIINVPVPTEERRKELSKQAKGEAENAKVVIRNYRKDAMRDLKKTELSDDMKGNAEIDIQKLTDDFIVEIDQIYKKKETDIMKN
jgi:ribosome recycling factor